MGTNKIDALVDYANSNDAPFHTVLHRQGLGGNCAQRSRRIFHNDGKLIHPWLNDRHREATMPPADLNGGGPGFFARCRFKSPGPRRVQGCNPESRRVGCQLLAPVHQHDRDQQTSLLCPVKPDGLPSKRETGHLFISPLERSGRQLAGTAADHQGARSGE